MPKKKHQAKFAKPQSTAPASLGASASRPIPPETQARGVNQLLADLRRASLASSNHTLSSAPTSSAFASTTWSSGPITLPPNLRQILQIPETPPPLPRRPLRNDANGRRLPPGPRAPQSWSAQRRNLARQLGGHSTDHAVHAEFHQLPGTYAPDRSSMTDLLLRKMALEWEFQGVYNQHYLSSLHSRLRSSLIAYIGTYGERGVTASDIRLLVLPQGGGYDEEGDADPSVEAVNELNNDLYCLDLSGSITHSLSVRELTDVLFPPRLARTVEVVQDSWDTADAPSLPPRLLPKLTHLSLAIRPSNTPTASWKQLLALAAKVPTLTHLSLAYWPEPSLTPNAKFSTIAGAQGRDVPYSGTGPYSHTLDDDWTEAIILLRRLSKYLYGLEYLDLTGCSAWYSVLTYEQDGDRIDWEGHWGKMTTLRLRYGFPISENTPEADREARAKAIAVAEQVEKRIVGKRAGKGRFITVERDDTERHA
ncbi:hypothetical protein BN1708_006045 [Verticillium longisporum]|uniref:Tafazzin n=1 Tax=Verticillium longisporum TaxID=100787 RepID=A0A0G4MH05_VERLO|nr:hypothetical protein BN1708_006045 [Verticillium longisporum]